MHKTSYPNAEHADIALILEGTYPYVRGGVSVWVKQLLQAFPHINFAVVFLGGNSQEYEKGFAYDLEPNVVSFQEFFLFDANEESKAKPVSCKKEIFDLIGKMHSHYHDPENNSFPEAAKDLDMLLNSKDGISLEQFLYSKESWEYLTKMYDKYCYDPSFVDYFWTIRNVHKPLWTLTRIISHIPNVSLVHSVSTGYAGFLGAKISTRNNVPLIISEHGLYTKERRIDLLNSPWINDMKRSLHRDPTEISYIRKLWIRFFQTLAKEAYEVANPIISLFKDYSNQQIEDGADPNKTMIIANGVDVEKFAGLRMNFSDKHKPIVALIGRVVTIKDIKTFIRSISYVQKSIPEVEAWIVGPVDEDMEYAIECEELISILDLADIVKFKGMQKVENVLPEIKVMALSSISEGLPLSILEAFAAGIPVVATRVGACEELIEGKDEEDKKLGAAGKVVDIADAKALALGIINFLENKTEWEKAQSAGIERVETYYQNAMVWKQYFELYKKVILKL